MLRSIVICLSLLATLQAQTLERIISHSLETHNSLKAIEMRLSGFDESLSLTQNFQNPTLSLNVGDIQFEDPLNRSVEPMQFTSINVKQKIPYFGKRDASYRLLKSKKDVMLNSLEAVKVLLVKEIKLTAYTIWEYEEKLAIVNEHIELTRKNIELSSVYSSSGDSSHMEAMTMRLLLSQLKIKREKIKTKLEALYSRISYLSFSEITSLEVDVDVGEPKSLNLYKEKLQNNKTYQTKLAEVDEKNSLVKVKELDSAIDPFISVGYFRREVNPDYMNLSVGASLPIYGSESLNEQLARKEVLESTHNSNDFYEQLRAELKNAHAQLRNKYKTYIIIKNESIPEVEHMFELTTSMLKSGNNLLLYTNILEKRLELYEQKISVMASYKRDLSDIQALLGEIK